MSRVIVFLGMAALALMVSCSAAGPNSPANMLATVEQVVLADLAAGKTLAEVETDVARALGGTTAADVVAVVQDALAILIDSGVLPANLRPVAVAYAMTEGEKIAARR